MFGRAGPEPWPSQQDLQVVFLKERRGRKNENLAPRNAIGSSVHVVLIQLARDPVTKCD
jgi:hypothetical protein